MDIYVYSDESGVFDKVHNKTFVFGGIVFLSKEDKDNQARKYISIERKIKKAEGIFEEAKATKIGKKSKNKLYRSLNDLEQFVVIIDEQRVLNNIFDNKKSKQRYLDYAYKIGIKRKFENLVRRGIINSNEVENIFFYVDEHTTATNGKYELKQALEQELKYGTFNMDYSMFFRPIFPTMKNVYVKFCNSSTVTLIRAADIVANRFFYLEKNNLLESIHKYNIKITYLP